MHPDLSEATLLRLHRAGQALQAAGSLDETLATLHALLMPSTPLRGRSMSGQRNRARRFPRPGWTFRCEPAAGRSAV
jgi:hypothetical protein